MPPRRGFCPLQPLAVAVLVGIGIVRIGGILLLIGIGARIGLAVERVVIARRIGLLMCGSAPRRMAAPRDSPARRPAGLRHTGEADAPSCRNLVAAGLPAGRRAASMAAGRPVGLRRLRVRAPAVLVGIGFARRHRLIGAAKIGEWIGLSDQASEFGQRVAFALGRRALAPRSSSSAGKGLSWYRSAIVMMRPLRESRQPALTNEPAAAS